MRAPHPSPSEPEPMPTADPDAWLTAVGPRVWTVCRRLDPQPEDAFQEVWEKVARVADRYDPTRGRVDSWILAITHRHLVDRHRRRAAQHKVLVFDPHAEAVSLPSSPDDRAARLDQALQRLPEHQRRIVVLHHVDGSPLEAIADAEGIAVGTVKSRLHRARARLLQLLGASR
jgi:RNA polymerase sigma-70 factor (ECF subfamily)